MRFFVVRAAICGLCQSANAQMPECKSMASQAGKYVDSINAEDALMNARLKNICWGC
jgi:hypothetical protein